MLSGKTVAISATILTWAIIAQASVPIIVETGAGRRQAMTLCSEASHELINGDIASAKQKVDRALQMDPKLWPAVFVRAEIFAHEGQYDLAIRDCNEALRQNRFFIDAALLRARINVRLGKYAEVSKELNSLVSRRPATVILGRVLSDRAWFQATCPDPSFRNGQQAVKDAKAACSILRWKDENTIDTLAAAYAETGDFNSAVQYASQALTIKDISPADSKRIQRHLESFQQRKPIRL
jgi:tetratricopeptide (TPR) repeat protein